METLIKNENYMCLVCFKIKIDIKETTCCGAIICNACFDKLKNKDDCVHGCLANKKEKLTMIVSMNLIR